MMKTDLSLTGNEMPDAPKSPTKHLIRSLQADVTETYCGLRGKETLKEKYQYKNIKGEFYAVRADNREFAPTCQVCKNTAMRVRLPIHKDY